METSSLSPFGHLFGGEYTNQRFFFRRIMVLGVCLGVQALSSARFIINYIVDNLKCFVKPLINKSSNPASVSSSIKWIKIPSALLPVMEMLWASNLTYKKAV